MVATIRERTIDAVRDRKPDPIAEPAFVEFDRVSNG